MSETQKQTPDQYVAARPDDLNPEKKLYLSGLQIWTRSLSLALKGDLSKMTAVVQKIKHAFPGLKLEKDEESLNSETDKSTSNH